MVTRALFDTNILIDHFNGIPEATGEIGYFDDAAISSITWIELMTWFYVMVNQGRLASIELATSERFLGTFQLIHVDDRIMREAAVVRANSIVATPKIALPDAIIRATGNVTSRLIITRNTRDFAGEGVRHPYLLTPGPAGNTGEGFTVTNIAPRPG